MNAHIQTIRTFTQNHPQLSQEEKEQIAHALKEVEKALVLIEFKCNKAEKERRSVGILLEETIEDLQKKTLVIERANKTLSNTLKELKDTQQHLVMAEKMASLGELTAGIAHEIQNPLNFINNFSEVSMELTEELNQEIAEGNTEEAMILTGTIAQNLEKIVYHGKRADSIVKNMLAHSRKSTGLKELVDINDLVDEYLRLSYHGLRAKDKTFNAVVQKCLDENVGQVHVIPQDLGRVLLNLFNNAFYAVNQRKKQEAGAFDPTVWVCTQRNKNHIELRVKDNGCGIPQKLIDKIYQPFFTTKPPGEGTGLGLSLSYDIITKGHGGELKVESKEDCGTEFIIHLPVGR